MSNHQVVIYMGTMGWSYKDWLGVFYPQESNQRDYLTYYSQVFNSLEIDSTFYYIPKPEVVTTWHQNTPSEFRFSAKLPKIITHDRGLVDVEDILTPFLSNMALLGEKIACYLVQLSPGYRCNETTFTRFKHFLDLLPVEDFRFAIEFRHQSWIKPSVFDLLRNKNVAWTIQDHPWEMPMVPEITANFTYIRWKGDSSDTRTSHVKEAVIDRTQKVIKWAGVLKKDLIPKVNTVFGYFSNHYSGHAPTNCNQMKKLMGLDTKSPNFGQQMSLF
jgi:uncharacterized protein YecE (DUF72 family)